MSKHIDTSSPKKLPALFSISLGFIVGLILLACEDSDKLSAESFATVIMIDNLFSPPAQRIPVDGRINFKNVGRNPHNAVAVDQSWGTDKAFGQLEMRSGDEAMVSFPEAGVFPYLCTYHATPDGKYGMVGSVIVGKDTPFNPKATGEKLAATDTWSGFTRKVPQDYPTIQNAVDAAAPGDLILIGDGIYKEEVIVTTPSITLRGTNRNNVIIDGEFVRGNAIMVVETNGVAIENMTARNTLLNGFFWTGVKGFRGEYLTAYNIGDYGVYAFDSVNGVINHSYASGTPDSGFYIGQCQPCKTILNDVIAEDNGLGYSGTNSGGELYLINSIWRNNMAGIGPNTLDSELLPPQRGTTIIGNIIESNSNLEAPVRLFEYPIIGNGIIVAGGRSNQIERNLILNHLNYGLLITPSLQKNLWLPHKNTVKGNIVLHSGRADIGISGASTSGNCFSNNYFTSSIPPLVEQLNQCGGLRYPLGSDLSATLGMLGHIAETVDGIFPSGDWKTHREPPPQPTMPEESFNSVKPATTPFEDFDLKLDEIQTPSLEAALSQNQALTENYNGIGISYKPYQPMTIITAIFLLIGYLMPFMIYATWTPLALWDLNRRQDIPNSVARTWNLFIILLPYIGSGAYLVREKNLSSWLRYSVLIVSLLACTLLIALALYSIMSPSLDIIASNTTQPFERGLI